MGNYVPASEEETKEMLDFLGLSSVDDLYRDVPRDVYRSRLPLPAGKSEMEVIREIRKLGAKNRRFTSIFCGAGAYSHYIPAIVKQVISKEAFRTTYTPYQAEISQGILQSIFEYQTMISELTGMDVSNASVYDGSTAAAEAIFMCLDRKKNSVLASGTMHPQVLEVMKTYCDSRHVDFHVIPVKEGRTDAEKLADMMGDGTDPVFRLCTRTPPHHCARCPQQELAKHHGRDGSRGIPESQFLWPYRRRRRHYIHGPWGEGEGGHVRLSPVPGNSENAGGIWGRYCRRGWAGAGITPVFWRPLHGIYDVPGKAYEKAAGTDCRGNYGQPGKPLLRTDTAGPGAAYPPGKGIFQYLFQ